MKVRVIIAGITLLFVSSCATFKSSIEGKYDKAGEKNFNSDKVSAVFIFKHYRQTKGLDAIPKLESKRERISGFDDFFLDALDEITNIDAYSTYTEYASDVSDSKRRATKDSLIEHHDVVLKMKFLEEKSFSKFFFGTVISTISLTLFPINYKYKYSVEVDVYNSENQLVNSYKREAHLNKWVQTFMFFLYPFHPEDRKMEELYVEFLHDIFKQIESEKILK